VVVHNEGKGRAAADPQYIPMPSCRPIIVLMFIFFLFFFFFFSEIA
jgi:hypothetical protein